MTATIRLTLDRVALARLTGMGYLTRGERDPAAIRDAAAAALADRLASMAPAPITPGVYAARHAA